jgi:adenine deaminase
MREVRLDDIECKGIPKQVIGLIPGQIITSDEGANIDYNLKEDIIKLVVIESHNGTMHTGIAYLKGMGLKKGAIGTTVAHDSHYMILAGTNDSDIVKAANELKISQGGKVFVKDGDVKAKLELPIAGLMTEENPQKVVEKLEDLKNKANVNEKMDAFMNLSFASLAVIGDVKLLPGGPFNVKEWRFITDEELVKKYREQKGIEPFDD